MVRCPAFTWHRRGIVLVTALLLAACRCQGPGTSVTTSELRVQPGRVDFGDVYLGTSGRVLLTVTNTGRAPASLGLSTAEPFAVTPTELELPGGESSSLTVTFAPSASGRAQGALAFARAPHPDVVLDGRGLDVPVCPSPPSCAIARFDLAARACVTERAPDGTSCASACLTDARCVDGECRGAVTAACDDGDACTVDGCSREGGCVHAPRDCAVADACLAAYCDPASGCGSRPLDDGTPCGELTCRTSNLCIEGRCVLRANPGADEVCTAVGLAATTFSACVLTRGGAVRCWGDGFTTLAASPALRRRFTRVSTLPRSGRPTSLSMNTPDTVSASACTSLAGGGLECATIVPTAASTVSGHENRIGTCWLDMAGDVTCLPARCPAGDGGVIACPNPAWPPGAERGVAHLSANGYSFCATRHDGGVVCWGLVEDLLRPPDGGAATHYGRAEFSEAQPAREYRRGTSLSCARFDDGFGCRSHQVDAGLLRLPATVLDVAPITSTTLPALLAVLEDGGVDACSVSATGFSCGPAFDAGLPPIAQAAAGHDFACLLTKTGDVACVGSNVSAQLGDLSMAPPWPSRVPGVEARLLARHIAQGTSHGLAALRLDGSVLRWGDLDTGPTPRTLGLAAPGARDLVVTHPGACVVRADGGVACFENGAVREVPTPFAMERFSGCESPLGPSWVSALGAGVRCSLPLEPPGAPAPLEAVCDRLDLTDEACAWTPDRRATCAVQVDGGVRCRGDTRVGHLGTGDAGLVVGSRVIPGLGPVAKVAMSQAQACALERSGRVQCWGAQVSGAVLPPRPLPIVLPFARDLTCGGLHCCVLVGENGVSCWGANARNELGRDLAPSDLPVAVPFFSRVEQLVAYDRSTCARLRNGHVWCWGDNAFGQRGFEPLRFSWTPVWVTQ